MSEGKRHLSDRLERLSHLRGRYVRFCRRSDAFFDGVSSILSVLQYIMAIACCVAMLVYAGFDSDSLDKHLIWKVLHAAQGIFIGTVLFNLIFRFRKTMKESLWLKRVADFLVLMTLLPVLFPHTGGSVHSVFEFLGSKYFLFCGLGLYSIAELCYGTMQMFGRRTNPSLILSVSFLIFILIGSFVLMLPRCTVTPIRYVDALFMAASAVSMTGLCTIDAAEVFTPMGWLVIAVLMQIGALGVLTFTSFFALFFSGKSSIYNQLLMRDFVYSKTAGSLMPMILYILGFTLSVEALGAVAIYFTLPDDFGGDFGGKVAFSAFHSLSAFCNGGFSTLPQGLADPKLLDGNQMIYLVFVVLILAGGIGFPNLVNFKEAIGEYLRRLRGRISGRRYIRRTHVYDINTKLVLLFSAIFFVGGSVMFYVLEYNHSFVGMDMKKKIIQSIFCSATVRTAGFSTVPVTSWLNLTFLCAMFIMWVGCSSQSMGGGIKVNTFAAVMLNLRSVLRGQKGICAFNRSVSVDSIRRAQSTVLLSILSIAGYSGVIMLLQPDLPMKGVMFECFSAITTVGMSLGITPELTDASKIVLVTAMFLGRVGIISVLCGMIPNRPDNSAMLPKDDIIIN